MRQNAIRIIICGDDGAGKTSLISCFLKERFDNDVPAVMPEIALPPQITAENVHIIVVDSIGPSEFTGEWPNTSVKIQALEQYRQADALCLMYNVNSPQSFGRLSGFWLPLLRSEDIKCPIIIIGSKIDLRTPSSTVTNNSEISNETLDQLYLPLMSQNREIETCIECSAKAMINVAEVFYFASKAVLHPSLPLLDSKSRKLNSKAINALTRIFHICDNDKDGVLGDEELNGFQRKVFGSPLQQQELEVVRDVVKHNFIQGIKGDSLTLEGFLYLHSLFVRRGRLETIWAVLRKFGYDNTLELRTDYLFPKLDIPYDCFTELSSRGYQFFTDHFQAYDQDKDGALNEKELEKAFETAPGNPWLSMGFPNNTIINENGALTLQGYLAMWSMTTLLDYKTTLAYLAYLGFEGNTNDGIKIVYPNRLTSKKGRANRTVFHALVFGATGSGKTELLKGLVKKPFATAYNNQGKSWTVVNSIEIRGAEKYLVAQEISPGDAKSVLDDKSKLSVMDVLCFVYDTSDNNSFAYVANLVEQFDLTGHPVIFIGTKVDRSPAVQDYRLSPERFAESLKIASPLKVSMKENNFGDLFSVILGVAINPRIAIPSYSMQQSSRLVSRIVFSTLIFTALAAAGSLIYAKYRK